MKSQERRNPLGVRHQNLHESTLLISSRVIQQLENALEKSWGKETCLPFIQDQWTEDNRAFGQCAVTALVIQDLFGGEIIYDEPHFHYWNKLPDGSMHDFSRKQFDLTVQNFTQTRIRPREELLEGAHAEKARTKERYEMLRARVLAFLH